MDDARLERLLTRPAASPVAEPVSRRVALLDAEEYEPAPLARDVLEARRRGRMARERARALRRLVRVVRWKPTPEAAQALATLEPFACVRCGRPWMATRLYDVLHPACPFCGASREACCGA